MMSENFTQNGIACFFPGKRFGVKSAFITTKKRFICDVKSTLPFFMGTFN